MPNPRIDDLRRKLEKDPTSRLFAQLAEELRKDGVLVEAMRVCREGLARHPQYPSARMTLGRCLFDSGDPGAARAEFEAVLAAAPDNLLAARLLGECHEALRDWPAAVAGFEVALALAPGDRQILARLDAARARLSASGREQAPIPVLEFADDPGALALDDWEPPAAGTPARPAAPVSAAIQAFSHAGEMQFEFEDVASVAAAAEPAVAPPAEGDAMASAEGLELLPDPGFESGNAEPEREKPTPVEVAIAEPVPELTGAAEASVQRVAAPVVPPPGDAVDQAQDVLASVTLADLYFQQGALERAAATYQLVLRRDPGNVRARERLASVEAARAAAARPLTRRERLERTIERLERLRTAIQGDRA